MSPELPLRENGRSSGRADELSVNVLARDSKGLGGVTLFALCFHYIVGPGWISVSGLTLLLAASDMDPACEASLMVCGSYGRSDLP